MPRPKDAKVWNEDLVKALKARQDQCRQQGKQQQCLWRDGWQAIEAVRADIYAFRNGRITNLPSNLSKTVEELCRKLISGDPDTHIYPPGYVPATPGQNEGNPYMNDHYANNIKKRGGAFAILMAFHVSARKVMTKHQICPIAQHFCDEEMEANFFAGRERGAWSGVKTLEKHGLVSANRRVAYNERARGLRSLGPHTFTLTPDGELFIDALLAKNPDIKQQISAARSQMPVEFQNLGTQSAAHLVTGGSTAPVARHTARKATPTSENSAKDDQELREWVQSAQIGQQKQFNVGKARRKYLHDLCDKLNSDVLNLIGRTLKHQSDGTSRSRALYVTMERLGASDFSFESVMSSVTTVARATQFSSPRMHAPPKAFPPRMIDQVASPGHVLGSGESPCKRSRKLPPGQAAAFAAMTRQAEHESRLLAKKEASRKGLDSDFPVDSTSPEDDPDFFDRKMPANPSIGRGRTQARENGTQGTAGEGPVVLEILDSDDEGDDNSPLMKAKPASRGDFVDLTESQESKCASATPQNLSSRPILHIYIDSRERNRNHTPRLLRMELTRLLSTGSLSMVWPRNLAKSIIEKQIESGDFAFELRHPSGSKRLPLLIERKRIGDLVQRSFRKDHWFQIQRMREEQCGAGGVCVILLEGDSRTTVQHTPYGAQAESYSPYDHTIDNEESLFRFIGRAILRG
jgi:hypothetical protein